MAEVEARSCPNCESELEASEAGDCLICPVCRFSERGCPDCGGCMWLKVEVPDGVIIEESGLPLDRCETVWICQDTACGLRRSAGE